MAEFCTDKGLSVIDISGWIGSGASIAKNTEETTKIAKEWHRAMVEFGCVIIVGHGIEEERFATLKRESKEFFNNTLDYKLKFNHGAYGHPSGGYCPPGSESVALSTEEQPEQQPEQTKSVGDKPQFDPVETFVFTSHPKNFASPLLDTPCPLPSAPLYFEHMEGVLKAIHSLSCAALGLSDLNYFDQFYDTGLSCVDDRGVNGNALKLAHYLPLTSTALVGHSSSVRYGAHTDYQGFTILRPDKCDWHTEQVHLDDTPEGDSVQILTGGLEVFHQSSQQWIQVKIPKDLNALVINAGDFFQRWTNDIWHSPLHRVVTAAAMQTASTTTDIDTATSSSTTTVDTSDDPHHDTHCPAIAGVYSRQAIVFFSGPLENAVIECIDPSLMRPEIVGDRLVRKYPAIRSGDHLLMKLTRTNAV